MMDASLLGPPLPQLALLALSTSLSPGPNNLLLAASCAWFGTRRTLPTLAGMYAGFALMLAAASFGAAAFFASFPKVLHLLQLVGAGYLVHLAVGLLKATWTATASAAPVGFGRATMLQFVNPKLWLMTLSTTSLCSRADAGGTSVSVPMVMAFVLMTVPGMLVYLKSGSLLRSLAASEPARLAANRFLAALTTVSALLMLSPFEAP